MSQNLDVAAHWNARYANADAVYGRGPNAFFSSWILGQSITGHAPGRMLLPADGEGRNGVYAAVNGWDVSTFDASSEGVAKSQRWAAEAAPLAGNMQSMVARAGHYSPAPGEKFDAIGLFYFHQQPESRARFHRQALEWLAPGGTLLLEGFGKGQLSFDSGGPPELGMLFSEAELRADFAGLDIRASGTFLVELDEGPYHQGAAEVVRFIARRT
jgi:hypothetical protein